MNRLITLKDLFLEELRDIYNSEHQIVEALPRLISHASSDELRQALGRHFDETKVHVERLEECFDKLGVSPRGETCEAMQGLLKEGEEILSAEAEPAVKDAGIICAAQKVEHYEIASYGCLVTFATLLQLDEVARLLEETLDEEKAADEILSEVAEGRINLEALAD